VLSLFGGIRGSLGLTTVGACTVFSAISGSSAATVAAIGRMLYPSLLEKGYPVSVASGFLAASGAIDVVIPPSIAMILYGVAAEESIRYLFIGGILPGLLMAALMALYIYFTARRLGIREGGKFSLANVGRTTRLGGWALGMPIIILGGIYTGIFSPTEAAGVACLYAIVVAVFIHRDLSWSGLWKVTIESVILTAQVLIIVAAAALFSRLLTIAGVPQGIATWIQEMQLSPIMVMLMINILLLAVGCVVDPASAILVLAPILKPVIVQAGIDPIHFGVVMTVNLSIGMFTPPFGLNIFIIQGMFKVPLPTLYRGLVPVIGVNLIALAIISAWPGLTLWLVRLIG
jgi:C4-dicarboxylate transporter DctM subunit